MDGKTKIANTLPGIRLRLGDQALILFREKAGVIAWGVPKEGALKRLEPFLKWQLPNPTLNSTFCYILYEVDVQINATLSSLPVGMNV